jgi:hypothetical protein
MSWQQKGEHGEFEDVDSMGKDLSAILFCPVRYLAYHYEKPVFECKCGISFPRFAVQAAHDSGDWMQIIQRHREGF